jgi:hypothetical protein
VVGYVHYEILAHNSQTIKAEVGTSMNLRGLADINASKACATISATLHQYLCIDSITMTAAEAT